MTWHSEWTDPTLLDDCDYGWSDIGEPQEWYAEEPPTHSWCFSCRKMAQVSSHGCFFP